MYVSHCRLNVWTSSLSNGCWYFQLNTHFCLCGFTYCIRLWPEIGFVDGVSFEVTFDERVLGNVGVTFDQRVLRNVGVTC